MAEDLGKVNIFPYSGLCVGGPCVSDTIKSYRKSVPVTFGVFRGTYHWNKALREWHWKEGLNEGTDEHGI